MLFQGQEFAASSPFFYFNDCSAGEAADVAAGRAKFLSQFRSYALPEIQSQLPEPSDPEVFRRSKLILPSGAAWGVYSMHRDLLRLRRDDPIFRRQDATQIHGAVLGPDAFLLRYFSNSHDTYSRDTGY